MKKSSGLVDEMLHLLPAGGKGIPPSRKPGILGHQQPLLAAPRPLPTGPKHQTLGTLLMQGVLSTPGRLQINSTHHIRYGVQNRL